MDKDPREDKALTQVIVQLLRDGKPQSVEQLIEMTKTETSVSEQKIIEQVLQLQSQGKITLKELTSPVPQNLSIYLKTRKSYWYWATVIFTTTTMLAVLTISEGTNLLAYMRSALAVAFVCWFPGYSLVRVLFPKLSEKSESRTLSSAERCAMSLGLSLVLVAIVGMLLNYTPWGIRLAPITLSVFSITAIFATAAIMKEYQRNK